MKKRMILAFALVITLSLTMILGGCGGNSQKESSSSAESTAEASSDSSSSENEERTYYYVAPYMGHPYVYDMFLGFKHAAEQYKVKIVQSGPDDFDTQAATEAFEQAIAKKPDGIITVMWDGSLVSAAQKAIAAGIPVICVEAAPAEHGCLTYIGLDNYQDGVDTANKLLELKGNSGKIVLQGNWGSTNIDEKLRGVKDVLAGTDWEILAEINDESDTEKAIEVAKAAMANYPDADAFIGLNSASGPGIAAAMEELGKAPDSLTVVCNDREDMTLEYIRSGYIDATLCNKTAMQCYLAVAMLEMYNTKGFDVTPVSADNAAAGVNIFPDTIYTGTFDVNMDNIDLFEHSNMGTYDTEYYES